MFPCSRHVRFHEEEEIVRINPRERSWLTGYEDYRHATTATRAKPLRPDATDAYVHLAKSEPPNTTTLTRTHSVGTDTLPATAKRASAAAWSPVSRGHSPPNGCHGAWRTAESAYGVCTVKTCSVRPKTDAGTARKLRTLCRRAFAGWASCGARTAFSTIACRTLRATIRTPAPATPAKSASACAGWHSWDCRC